jgi:DNA-binding response OmpR family regulator
MKVLIADADPASRSLLVSLLEQWDFQVILAVDGQQAWDILQRPDAPKLVILDWMMPGIDGFEVCKLVRQTKDGDFTYILLMTGTRQKEDIVKVIVAGADDFMLKPFDPMELQMHLRAARRILRLEEQLNMVKA